jgi:hypothetical protein
MSDEQHDSTNFLIDRIVSDGSHVFFARALSIGIQAGRVAFPATTVQDDQGVANRLLIFTGTVAAELRGSDEGKRTGVLRLQLQHPLSTGVHFVGSATVASLAAFHTEDDEVLFGVNSAETVKGPTAGNLDGKGLPDNDLYVIIDLTVQSNDAHLDRISYQANVLVRDTTPELESLLVRQVPGSGGPFVPEITISPGGRWEYQVTLTSPVVKTTELILISTSDPAHIPVGVGSVAGTTAVQLNTSQVSGVFGTPATNGGADARATITASFTRGDGSVVVKKAIVNTKAPR